MIRVYPRLPFLSRSCQEQSRNIEATAYIEGETTDHGKKHPLDNSVPVRVKCYSRCSPRTQKEARVTVTTSETLVSYV